MRRLLFLIVLTFALPTFAFAQDGDGGGIDINLLHIIGTLIVGVGIPLAVNILKQVWSGGPGWLKTVAPIIIVPLLGMAGAWLSAWVGIPVDFGPVIDIILSGATLGAASTMAFKLGAGKPHGFVATMKTVAGKG